MTDPQAICVFLTAALGDFINALPALWTLRRRFPASRIELAGNPSWLPLAAAAHLVDRTHSIEGLPLSEGFQRPLPTRGALARFLERFDLVLSWFGDTEGRWAEALRHYRPGRAVVHPFHRHLEFPGHVSDFFLQTLTELGIHPLPSVAPGLAVPQETRPAVRGKPNGAALSEPPYICLHPGSGGRHKNWPRDRFLAVALGVRSAAGTPPVKILLGPAEEDSRPFWVGGEASGVDVVGNLGILELATVLAGADAYLGNDSGVTHLAAALGVPTVALFGPTEPRRWGPKGPNVRILRGEAPCSPCTSGCEMEPCGLKCLCAIEVCDVMAALEDARKGRNRGSEP